MEENRFVIADPGLCVGCKTCMAACLTKHFVKGDVAVPRLNLVQTKAVSAPIVCHHCEDAPCVASCPVGALYFDEGRVAIKQSRCIGCRSCMMACPYGAVQIVGRPVTRTLGNVSLGEGLQPYVVKCDLCYDRPEGPACVQACITGALRVVDSPQLNDNSKSRRVAAARAAQEFSSLPLNPSLV